MPDPTSLTVHLSRGDITTALVYPARRDSRAALILAHGAGAGQRSPFMVSFACTNTAGSQTHPFRFRPDGEREVPPSRSAVL